MPPPPRKRMRRAEHLGDARFITFSCYQRLPLFNNATIRDLFVTLLAEAQSGGGWRLHAWVVMPEHIHLVLSVDADLTLSHVLAPVKSAMARRVIARWRVIQAPILGKIPSASGETHFWQLGGGFDRSIRSSEDVSDNIRYVHRNPVKRGLVATPEE